MTPAGETTANPPPAAGATDTRKPLGAMEMRARRCPRAIAFAWAWRAAVAALFAGPAAALAQQAFGAPPEGDRELWEPGGHALLVLLTRETHGLAVLGREAVWLFLVGVAGGLVPMTALMLSIADPMRAPGRPARLAARAVARFPVIVALALAVWAMQATVAGVGFGLVRLASDSTADALGEVRSQMLGAAVAGAFALPFVALAIVHDLARAAVIRTGATATRAFFLGAGARTRAPWRTAWAWAWRGALGWLAVWLAAIVAGRCDGTAGVAPLLAAAIAHQTVLCLRVALRASWLARALRAVG